MISSLSSSVHLATQSKSQPASHNLGFGGMQTIRRDTKITDAATELGGCAERVFKDSDVQWMSFTDDDHSQIVSPYANTRLELHKMVPHLWKATFARQRDLRRKHGSVAF